MNFPAADVEAAMAELEHYPEAGFAPRPPEIVIIEAAEYEQDREQYDHPRRDGERQRGVYVVPDGVSDEQNAQLHDDVLACWRRGFRVDGVSICKTDENGRIGFLVAASIEIYSLFDGFSPEQVERHASTKDGYAEIMRAVLHHIRIGRPLPTGLAAFAAKALTNPRIPRKHGQSARTAAYLRALEVLEKRGWQRTRNDASRCVTACDLIAEAATKLGVPESYDSVRRRIDRR